MPILSDYERAPNYPVAHTFAINPICPLWDWRMPAALGRGVKTGPIRTRSASDGPRGEPGSRGFSASVGWDLPLRVRCHRALRPVPRVPGSRLEVRIGAICRLPRRAQGGQALNGVAGVAPPFRGEITGGTPVPHARCEPRSEAGSRFGTVARAPGSDRMRIPTPHGPPSFSCRSSPGPGAGQHQCSQRARPSRWPADRPRRPHPERSRGWRDSLRHGLQK